MRITIRLFAVLREKTGVASTEMEFSAGATIAAAARDVAVKYPGIADLIFKTAFAVNHEYAPSERVLSDGDELAFIPAVSGGKCDMPVNAGRGTHG